MEMALSSFCKDPFTWVVDSSEIYVVILYLTDQRRNKFQDNNIMCIVVSCVNYYYRLTYWLTDCSHRRYWLLATKNELANNSCLGSTANCSSGSTGRMSFSGRSFFSNMSFGKRKPFLNIRLVPIKLRRNICMRLCRSRWLILEAFYLFLIEHNTIIILIGN